jgi:uncharacterized membrane protein
VYVAALPGTFVDPSRPVARLQDIGGDADESVRSAFTIADERSFEQDPRFGVSVLAEIASRALSPAMNDPGTAIDVLGRSVRVLATWANGDDEDGGSRDCTFPRVHVPAVRLGDLFDDVFAPIARDGAAFVEVQIRLQKALLALARIGDARFARHAARLARLALARAETGLALEEEKARVREIAALVERRVAS